MTDVLDVIRPELPSGADELLRTLVDVLNDPAQLHRLDLLAAWRQQEPIALDSAHDHREA
jgi:hypothetical protein